MISEKNTRCSPPPPPLSTAAAAANARQPTGGGGRFGAGQTAYAPARPGEPECSMCVSYVTVVVTVVVVVVAGGGRPGTMIQPMGYVVLCRNVPTLRRLFNVACVGNFTGKLSRWARVAARCVFSDVVAQHWRDAPGFAAVVRRASGADDRRASCSTRPRSS